MNILTNISKLDQIINKILGQERQYYPFGCPRLINSFTSFLSFVPESLTYLNADQAFDSTFRLHNRTTEPDDIIYPRTIAHIQS